MSCVANPSAVTAPLDILKIRLQILLIYGEHVGVRTVAARLLRNEGVAAFWKGNVPAEMLYIVYGASQFTSYSVLNTQLARWEARHSVAVAPSTHSFAVGCGAGLFSTLVTYPFDLLRTRLAANCTSAFHSLTVTSRAIWAESGPAGFLAGLRPTLVSTVATSGCFFWAYSISRSIVQSHSDKFYGLEAICGFVAGATAKAATFPLDTLRKRMQMTLQQKAVQTFFRYLAKHGVFGFYRGFGVSLLKSAPSSAISVATYEYAISATRSLRGAFT